MPSRAVYSVTPSAARLTESLRDIGYDFVTAVADVVDNSIAADASRIDIILDADRDDPWVVIADDGAGLTANTINEALRFGSRSSYLLGDLGRYGLGLKTASLSQCRAVTLASRRPGTNRTSVRKLDLDVIAEWDEWLVVDPGRSPAAIAAVALLDEQMSTVVVWEQLDRLLPGRRDTGFARRRLQTSRRRLVEHLSMVFHRYLDGDADHRVTMTVNGEKVQSWDPFATAEAATRELTPHTFELAHGDAIGTVMLRRWVLPARHRFSSPEIFDRLAGPLKWNRQQGLYVYRANRLVQWGGWGGLRAIDEHTKLARASLEFNTDLDAAFAINVAKIKVAMPPELRQMLERPVNELCQSAEASYRRSAGRPAGEPKACGDEAATVAPRAGLDRSVGLALMSAAAQTGRLAELREIAAAMTRCDPQLAAATGIDVLA